MLGFGGLAVPKINLIMSLICRDYLAEKEAQDPTFTYLPIIFGEDNSQCQIPPSSIACGPIPALYESCGWRFVCFGKSPVRSSIRSIWEDQDNRSGRDGRRA